MPLGQNPDCAVDVCRNDREAKFTREPANSRFEFVKFTVRRAGAFRVENQNVAFLRQETTALCQAGRQTVRARPALDWDQIHPGGNQPAHAGGAEEIVARAEQREFMKAAATRGHQGGAVSMAAMVTTKQKRLIGKLVLSLHREWRVKREERAAERFKQGAADRRSPDCGGGLSSGTVSHRHGGRSSFC